MDDTKRALINARDAIDKKNFEEAINTIKNVLKNDKNNYMALVLLGVAFQDSTQAPLAFKKAISLHSNKILAWQGLASYYEKQNSNENLKELLDVYKHLLTLEEDSRKFEEICNKYLEVTLKLDDFNCVSILFEHSVKLNSPNKCSFVHSIIVRALSKITMIKSEKCLCLFQNVFDKCDNITSNNEFVYRYFEYIHFMKGFKSMLEKYRELLKTSYFTYLEDWICLTFVKSVAFQKSSETDDLDVLEFIDKLTNTYSKSFIKSLTQAAMFFTKEDYFNAHYLVHNLFIAEKENNLLTIMLGYCCLKLQRWMEAESVGKKLIKQKNIIVSEMGWRILLISLCNQNVEKCLKAVDIKNQIDNDSFGKDEYKALFSAYIQIDNIIEAEKCLNYFKTKPEFHSLNAQLLKKCGKKIDAFNILNVNKETSQFCWFELSLYYWEEKEYQSVLLPLIHAAKFEKNNFKVFLYLGHYYTKEGNLEKAKKCFLKAFTLNPESSQAGRCLSDTYRNLHDWEANFELLKNLSETASTQDSWTWLELGLHHFALEQWDEAIVNLRTYVRHKPNDIEAWESLADAYYSRGSFTSALKCYNKATELDSKRKYSYVQIGTVQCLLGQYLEALGTYELIEDDFFLPALKGMADVYLCLANENFSQNLFGNCRDNAQETIYLITKALLKGNHFVSLWNTLSTAVTIIARLPSKYRWLYIDDKFYNKNEEDNKLIILFNEDVFELAIRSFCKAINMSTTKDAYLYHELATVYFDYYSFYNNVSAAKKAYATITISINQDKSNWQYWNSLGVICMSQDIKKYAIAQHAFIKAISLEFSNAMLWSNLGILYFYFKDNAVSNKCFRISQQFDPSYVQSWIGQAMIAESVQHEDAMDLFRHSSQIAFHKESSLGYAEWVCKTLMSIKGKTKKLSKIEYAIENMHAIPIACDLMTWLIEYEDKNPCCLNILGILQEKMGLLNKAVDNYEKASTSVESKYKDMVLVNYARALHRLGKYEKAISVFKSVSEASFYSATGLAFSLYKSGKYEEAFGIYGTALQWLSEDEREKSQILVAMAAMAYNYQNTTECKTLLFQSVQYSKNVPCIPGLLAIYSFGLLHSEHSLAKLVMDELIKLKDKEKYSSYIGFFESYILLKNNLPTKAIRQLSKYLHIYPNNAYLWQHMSAYCFSETFSNAFIASQSAQKSIVFDKCQDNIIRSYRLACLAEMFLGNLRKSRMFAQKAIHMNPNNAKNWTLLVYIMLSQVNKPGYVNQIENLINYIKTYLNPTKLMCNWLEFSERHFLVTA